MDLNKNYPWLNSLKISDEDIQKWKEKSLYKSLTFWSLVNKSIDQKIYFNWAIDHYQIPFLQDIFFEQHLMSKTQWNEIKDVFDWTEEILPVAFWNDTVFIGCIEPPEKKTQILNLETRFVLVSCQSLQIMWKFIQSLSHFIEKEVTQSFILNKSSLNKKPGLKSRTINTNVSLNKNPELKTQTINTNVSLNKKPSLKTQTAHENLPLSKNPELKTQIINTDLPLNKNPELKTQQTIHADLPLNKNPELKTQTIHANLPLNKNPELKTQIINTDLPLNKNPELKTQIINTDLPLNKKPDIKTQTAHANLPLNKKSELKTQQTIHANLPLNKNPELKTQTVHTNLPLNKNPELKTQTIHANLPLNKNPDLKTQTAHANLPLNKKSDLKTQTIHADLPLNKNPELKTQIINTDLPLNKKPDIKTQTAHANLPLNKKPLMQTSFPEVDKERVEINNNTFPGRSPVEDNILVMENLKNKNPTSHAHDKKKDNETKNLTHNSKFTFVDTVDKTLTHVSASYNHEELWKYTKSFYCTSIILKVKNDKAHPISWTGKIKCSKTENIFVDLNDYSLFKILKKGYSYNGFVIDNPVNKKFFNQIGWMEYPKQVTAVPIKDNKNNLINVFVGLSLELISRSKIQQIEEHVLQFFHNNQKSLKAA